MAKKRRGEPNKAVFILADETQENYDEIERGWNDEFGPENYMERRLVKILVDNDWFLQRAVPRLHAAEAAEGNVELMHRYKNSAERSSTEIRACSSATRKSGSSIWQLVPRPMES